MKMNGTMLTDKMTVKYENEGERYEEKKLSAYSMAAVGGSIIINIGIVIYAVISAIIA
jgi:formate/nitrite transporter FocA (FNT family)